MKFLPIENITFTTHLSEEEVIERLMNIIEPEKSFRFRSTEKPYEGTVKGNEFTIYRIIKYRNSFLPKINGIIKNNINQTEINVSMNLKKLVFIFLCIWCGFVSIFGLVFLKISFSNFNPFVFQPLVMLLFAYLITILGFKYESNKSKKYLQELFEAEMIEH